MPQFVGIKEIATGQVTNINAVVAQQWVDRNPGKYEILAPVRVKVDAPKVESEKKSAADSNKVNQK